MCISQAVILAGGLGTRLEPFTLKKPKPMFEIEGIPFLQHILAQVGTWGIRQVVLLLGYKAEIIQDYFGDGSQLGIQILYSVTMPEFNTGARLRAAKNLINDEFILLYCDNYCPINLKKAYKNFKASNDLIQITAYSNRDSYTRNNLMLKDKKVIVYDKKREVEGLQAVDIGYAFIRKEVLNRIPEKNVNFEASVYPSVVQEGRMGVYLTEHRYYSIGSWERIELTREFFRPKKVIFLDRDGTINVRPAKACYVEKPEDFIWLPKAKEAIKKLNELGYSIYIITNQPGIARGMLSLKQLEKIHKKMHAELSEIGAKISDVYYCPHGWDDQCDCRKPKPGMLYQAQRDHSLNLTECMLIGDDERDIQAGETAELKKCILVSEENSLWDVVKKLED